MLLHLDSLMRKRTPKRRTRRNRAYESGSRQINRAELGSNRITIPNSHIRRALNLAKVSGRTLGADHFEIRVRITFVDCDFAFIPVNTQIHLRPGPQLLQNG